LANLKRIGETTTQFFSFADDQPFVFQDGSSLQHLQLAYETYGELNAARDNAILVFHAMSGSAHAAGINPDLPEAAPRWTKECQLGWWDGFIGPGKAIDTDQFHVICANYIGGCYGSTGPASINPETGTPYGRQFPMITISDIVDTQMRLLDALQIDVLHAAIGPSIGGMLTLNLATRYPQRVKNVIPMSSGMTVSTLQRALNFEQIYAIEEDPAFRGGDYYDGEPPAMGLALARMIAHKTYISLYTLEERARSEILQRDDDLRSYQLSSSVESYMLHQGRKFVERFDANSYLRILSAWQHYDLLKDAGASDYSDLFSRCSHQRTLIFSIDSDVCYYPEEQLVLASAMKAAGIDCQHITAHSDKGHDAFLLEPKLFAPHIDYRLKDRHT
jgi:homoserine O-acetyltransferase/O-succinyltransferase